tara:strand:+ start:1131 stop:1727 length:597 start_codon:yes stop_codon:yes gene_type:complete
MRKVIQLILFLFLIFITVLFYLTYFNQNKKSEINLNKKYDESPIEDEDSLQNKNNLIKQLKYEVNLDQNSQYSITAESSEISYENNVELVKMNNVIAIFIDEKNIPLTVTSEKANYNNSNFNTNFSNNVRIQYIDNVILSEKMDINFDTDIVTIYENVEYEGLQGTIKSDYIKINLITKKIDIYMNNIEDKVKVETKK